MRSIKYFPLIWILLWFSNSSVSQTFPWWEHKLFDNVVRDTSMNLFKVDSAQYNWVKTSNWRGKRYLVKDRNYHGLMTYAEQWEAEADTDSLWILNKKYYTEYFDNGNIREYRQEFWNTDSSDWVIWERQVQRENGQLLEYISKSWHSLPMACGGSKKVLSYNEYDSITDETRYSWNLYSGYTKNERRQYFYNDDHQKEKMIFQDEEQDEWINITRIDYFYDENLCSEWLIYRWNTSSYFWELYSKRINNYDDFGNMIQWTYFYLMENGFWRPSQRMTRAFNEFSHVIEGSDSQYDTITSEWQVNYFRTWVHHDDTIFYEHNWYKWRADTGIFENIWKQKHLFDEFLLLTRVINFHGSWSVWDTSEYFNLYYDEYQRIIMFNQWDWLPYPKEVWNEIYYWDQTVDLPSYNKPIDQSVIKIYPNPTRDDFTIIIPDDFQNSNIRIFNQLGMLVWDHPNLNQKELKITLTQPPGIYFVKITNHNSSISGKLILLNR